MSESVSPKQRSYRKPLIIVLKAAVSGSLLYLVLKKAGLEQVVGLITGIDPAIFIFAVLLYVLALYVSCFRWRTLLLEHFRISRLFSLYLIGSFFNIMLPTLVGGDVFKAYYLYKDTGRAGQTLASVFMDRYLGFVSLMLIGLLAYPFGFPYFRGLWVAWMLPLIILLFALASVFVFGLRFGRRFSPVRDIYGYFDTYRKRKDIVIKAILISFVVQGLIIFLVYVLSLGLGLRIPPLMFVVFFPVIVAVSTLPVSISGVGLREASFVLMLGFAGVSADKATALSLSWFIAMAVGSLPGLVLYIRQKESSARPAANGPTSANQSTANQSTSAPDE